MSLELSFRDPIMAPRSICQRSYFAFHHVSKAFGPAVVLDDISFEVNRGSIVCIVDSNGAGKAICHLLMGFLKPDSGRVIAVNEDITDYSADQLEKIYRKVTMIFQDDSVFDHSATAMADKATQREQHFSSAQRQDCQRIEALLGELGIRDIREFSCHDWDTGAQRWIALAKVLGENPEAVLFDRSGIKSDPLETCRFVPLLHHLRAELKMTSIVVTHDREFARRIADQVLFLHHGKLLFSGSADEMRRSLEPVVRDFMGEDQSTFRALRRLRYRGKGGSHAAQD